MKIMKIIKRKRPGRPKKGTKVQSHIQLQTIIIDENKDILYVKFPDEYIDSLADFLIFI